MQPSSSRRSLLAEQMKWAVLFALVLSALTSLRDISSMYKLLLIEGWLWSIASQLTLFLFWAVVTPLVLAAMERGREKGWNTAQSVLFHAALYAVLVSVFYVFVVFVNLYVWPAPGERPRSSDLWEMRWFISVVLNSALKYYLPILLAGTLYAYYRRLRSEELKAAELREQLMESQFRLLKMQLHPHFLFNALHSISSLVYSDPPRADRMIAQFSELLRLSLETSDVVLVPLREELEYVKKYLEIEQIRFSNRLAVKYSIAADVLAVDVPNLILQPLVENAIKHGIAKQESGGTIEISAYKRRGGLILAVEDNGPGFAKNKTDGIGIRNVSERLRKLYMHRARLTLTGVRPHGARQELFLPVDDINAFFEVPVTELGPAT